MKNDRTGCADSNLSGCTELEATPVKAVNLTSNTSPVGRIAWAAGWGALLGSAIHYAVSLGTYNFGPLTRPGWILFLVPVFASLLTDACKNALKRDPLRVTVYALLSSQLLILATVGSIVIGIQALPISAYAATLILAGNALCTLIFQSLAAFYPKKAAILLQYGRWTAPMLTFALTVATINAVCAMMGAPFGSGLYASALFGASLGAVNLLALPSRFDEQLLLQSE